MESNDFYNDILVDDLYINEGLPCPQPTNLSASNITGNSADLNWIAGGTETAWDVQYGNSGFSLSNGTIIGVTANPYTLTGLTATTTYDYYVKAICAPGDGSVWTGPFTFTTLPPQPSALNASNTTASSSDLSWTAGGTEIAWDIQYGASGFISGNVPSVTVASNPYTLTGLISCN